MTIEKRTVGSEIREFCEELRDGFLAWRRRRQAHTDVPRSPAPTETETPQANEIIFTPLPLETNAGFSSVGGNQAAATSQAGGGRPGVAIAPNVCPVTRQALDPASKIYECRQCGMYYSEAGWEFLLQHAKGQCCGCRSIKTVLPVVRAR